MRSDLTVTASAVVAVTPPGCMALDFRQPGTERRRDHCPHPHSPFPSQTEPSEYDGVLVAAHREIEWEEEHLLPVAVFSRGDETYVLAQRFDCGRWWSSFAWYRRDRRGAAERVPLSAVEDACAEVALTDPQRHRDYATWRLEQLLENGQARAACQAFVRYAAANPRFIYQDCTPPSCRPDTAWPDVAEPLAKSASSCRNKEELWYALHSALHASREDDWLQDVRFVMYAMYKVDRPRAIEELTSFGFANPGQRAAEANAFLRQMKSVEEKGYW